MIGTCPIRRFPLHESDDDYFYMVREDADQSLAINALFYLAHPDDEEAGYGSDPDSVMRVVASSVMMI